MLILKQNFTKWIAFPPNHALWRYSNNGQRVQTMKTCTIRCILLILMGRGRKTRRLNLMYGAVTKKLIATRHFGKFAQDWDLATRNWWRYKMSWPATQRSLREKKVRIRIPGIKTNTK